VLPTDDDELEKEVARMAGVDLTDPVALPAMLPAYEDAASRLLGMPLVEDSRREAFLERLWRFEKTLAKGYRDDERNALLSEWKTLTVTEGGSGDPHNQILAAAPKQLRKEISILLKAAPHFYQDAAKGVKFIMDESAFLKALNDNVVYQRIKGDSMQGGLGSVIHNLYGKRGQHLTIVVRKNGSLKDYDGKPLTDQLKEWEKLAGMSFEKSQNLKTSIDLELNVKELKALGLE